VPGRQTGRRDRVSLETRSGQAAAPRAKQIQSAHLCDGRGRARCEEDCVDLKSRQPNGPALMVGTMRAGLISSAY
jgi:hypothetical protein